MKIRIKAAVVLNHRETHILANVLARNLSAKNAVMQPSEEERAEEKQVMQDFLAKREELGRRLNR